MATISYATLTEVKRQWEQNNETLEGTTSPQLMSFARRATDKVNLITRRNFAPRIETRYQDDPDQVDNGLRRLSLDMALSELTSVTLADGTGLSTSTEVRMWPRGRTPGLQLQLLEASSSNWTDISDTPWSETGVSVVGKWAYREHYTTEGWRVADTTGEAIADTTTTEFDIAGEANATNWVNDTPNFDLGQLIQIDDEYMAVVDTTANDPASDTITVVRGVRGSTAALHDTAATISVFIPEGPIIRATQLMSFFDYARRGEKTRATFDGVSVVAGMEVPNEVAEILSRYTRLDIGG